MKAKSFLVAVFVIAVTNVASADTIRGIDMDFVTIGNPGNAADTGGRIGSGAVSYNYRIGKYEVTNAQWDTFVGISGKPQGNGEGYIYGTYHTGAQIPTSCVSWYEALQFCNYLTSGDKSKGVYQFSGNNANAGDFLGIDRMAAESAYGTIYFLPSEDEWYKAAYYKPDGSGYSLYADGTNTDPIAGINSNYNGAVGQSWNVGTGTQEQNGTFDMMGNLAEWTETLHWWEETQTYGRCYRGGTYNHPIVELKSSWFSAVDGNPECINVGFRIASDIPEPSTLLLLGLGAAIIRKFKN
jgi:formylglycine-generating enzyme